VFIPPHHTPAPREGLAKLTLQSAPPFHRLNKKAVALAGRKDYFSCPQQFFHVA
jgi:hypothetical protein